MKTLKHYLKVFSRRKCLPSDILRTPLDRCLGVSGLVFIGLAYGIGSGIYMITGEVIRYHAGAATILSYVISGVAALLSALSYAEFGAIVPLAGSSYTYTYVIIGECWAFIVGWNMVLEYTLGVAATAKTFSSTVDWLTNGTVSEFIGENVYRTSTAGFSETPDFIAVAVIMFGVISIAIGLHSMEFIYKCLLSVNLLTLAVVTVAGFTLADLSNWTAPGFAPYGVSGIFRGAAICFFAYVGFDALTVASEDSVDPQNSIPKAIGIMMGTLVTVYTLVTISLTLVVPYYIIDPINPFPSAFASRHMFWVQYVVITGMLTSLFVATFVALFVFSHLVYSISGDGLFPAFLSDVNKTTKIPIKSVLFCSITCSAVALIIDQELLIQLFSIGSLFSFVVVSSCVILVRYRPTGSANFDHIMKDDTELTNLTLHMKPNKVEKLSLLQSTDQPKLYRIVVIALVMMVTSMCALSLLVTQGGAFIMSITWWALLLLALFTFGTIVPLVVIWSFPQHPPTGKFQVPCVPLVPALSILFNIGLIMMLEWLTWVRLIVWIVIGLILYVAYGVRHSKENYDADAYDEFIPGTAERRQYESVEAR